MKNEVQIVELCNFYSVNIRPISANSLYKCWRGRFCKSTSARNFKHNFLQLLRNPKKVSGKIKVEYVVYFKKYRQDFDNCLKVLNDACNGILWDDDSMIDEANIKIVHPAEQDKIEICITELY